MAKYYVIFDEQGIVRVDRAEDAGFWSRVSDVKNFKDFLDVAKGADPFRFLPEVFLHDEAIIRVSRSDRLSDEEKFRYLQILESNTPVDDLIPVFISGEFDRTHPPQLSPSVIADAGGAPSRPVIAQAIDP